MAKVFRFVFAYGLDSPPLAAVSVSPAARTAAECRPGGFLVEGAGQELRICQLARDCHGRRVDPLSLGIMGQATTGLLADTFSLPGMQTFFSPLRAGVGAQLDMNDAENDNAHEGNAVTHTFMRRHGALYEDCDIVPEPLPLRRVGSGCYRLVILPGHRERSCPTQLLAASAWWLCRRPAAGVNAMGSGTLSDPVPIALTLVGATLLTSLLELLDTLPVYALQLKSCHVGYSAVYGTVQLGPKTAERLLELSICDFGSDSLSYVEQCRHLRSFSVTDSNALTYQTVHAVLKRCRELRFLRLPRLWWEAQECIALAIPSSLEVLTLTLDPATAGLEWVARCTALQELHLMDCRNETSNYNWVKVDHGDDEEDTAGGSASNSSSNRSDVADGTVGQEQRANVNNRARDRASSTAEGNKDSDDVAVEQVVTHASSLPPPAAHELGDSRFLLDLSPLVSLTRLEKLTVSSRYLRDVSALASCKQLRELCLAGCRNVTSIDALAASTVAATLRYLNLSSTGLAQLPRGMGSAFIHLQVLNLSSTHVDNVAALADAPMLAYLDLTSTTVTDVSPLATCPLLRHLTGLPSRALRPSAGGTVAAAVAKLLLHLPKWLEVLDLSDATITDSVTFPPTLRQLRLRACVVSSLCGLGQAKRELQVVVLEGCSNANLSGLDEITSLEIFVAVDGTRLTDFSFLQASSATLRVVKFKGTNGPVSPLHLHGLENCVHLERLEIRQAKGLVDLAPLAGLTQLREVELMSTGIRSLHELSASSASLELVNVTDCANLSDLGDVFARSRRLRHLYMDGTLISDLRSLQHCQSLEKLCARMCTRLTDVDASLSGLRHLRTVNLFQSSISAIHDLRRCPRLQYLCLNGCNNLTTVEGLAGCLSVDHLFIHSAAELQTIGHSARVGRLSAMSAINCPKLVRIAGLEREPRLTSLVISGSLKLTSLGNSTRGYRRLVGLWIVECKAFKSITAITSSEHLVSVILRHTAVTDLSPLKVCLKKSLKRLDLTNNEDLVDLAMLRFGRHLEVLSLCGTSVRDLQPLTPCANLRAVDVDNCLKLHSLSPLAQLPNLTVLYARRTAATTAQNLWKRRLHTVYLQGSISLDNNHVKKVESSLLPGAQWGAPSSTARPTIDFDTFF